VRSELSEKVARLGYGARGVVYLVLGGLASAAAFGAGGEVTSTQGVFQEILSQPFGSVLLAIVALGLLCFALWRVAQSLLDADHMGTDGRALITRAGLGASAVVNAALAVSAAGLLLGLASGGSGDSSAQDWTASLLSAPLGRWLVAGVGLAIAGTGLALGWKGWQGDVAKRLSLTSEQRRWAVPLGRAGYLARGLVFVVIGSFLLLAALQADPAEAKGITGALRTLEQQPYGWALFGLTALGLFAFGAFQLAVAVFRRIEAPDVDRALSKLRQDGRRLVS
jgi:hypothetical protein